MNKEKKGRRRGVSSTLSFPVIAAAKKLTQFQNNEVATFIDMETVAFRDGSDFSRLDHFTSSYESDLHS